MTFQILIFISVFVVLPLGLQAQPGTSENTTATQTVAPQVINEILFSESAQSWTTRDRRLYEKLKAVVLGKEKLSQYVETGAEDFLLSRLSAREAVLFEVGVGKLKLTEVQRKNVSDFSSAEIDAELLLISQAEALIELKETQLKQKARFTTWLDLLKRKYQVRIKSTEFK